MCVLLVAVRVVFAKASWPGAGQLACYQSWWQLQRASFAFVYCAAWLFQLFCAGGKWRCVRMWPGPRQLRGGRRVEDLGGACPKPVFATLALASKASVQLEAAILAVVCVYAQADTTASSKKCVCCSMTGWAGIVRWGVFC